MSGGGRPGNATPPVLASADRLGTRITLIKLFGVLAESGIFCDAGIGEYDIEPAFVLFDDRKYAVEIAEVRHVAFEGFDIFADVLTAALSSASRHPVMKT
ncbi:MAG TPA: hypothetical protein VIF02_00460 [Methylocella sp.]